MLVPLFFEGCWRLEGFWGEGMGLRGDFVASRRVEDVFVVVLGDGWDLDTDG